MKRESSEIHFLDNSDRSINANYGSKNIQTVREDVVGEILQVGEPEEIETRPRKKVSGGSLSACSYDQQDLCEGAVSEVKFSDIEYVGKDGTSRNLFKRRQKRID